MKIKFAKQWDSVSQLWKKFYPITITSAVVDADRGQRMNATLADIYSTLFYEDVYIGAAAASSTIRTSGYHHDSITRGRPIAISNASSGSYIWVILPASYSPAVMMGGIEVPMALDSTITISGKSYKIWKSSNTYAGSFNLYLM